MCARAATRFKFRENFWRRVRHQLFSVAAAALEKFGCSGVFVSGFIFNRSVDLQICGTKPIVVFANSFSEKQITRLSPGGFYDKLRGKKNFIAHGL